MEIYSTPFKVNSENIDFILKQKPLIIINPNHKVQDPKLTTSYSYYNSLTENFPSLLKEDTYVTALVKYSTEVPYSLVLDYDLVAFSSKSK